MKARDKCLVGLLVLGFCDIFVPVPIIGLVLLYIIFDRPGWFRQLVDEIYG